MSFEEEWAGLKVQASTRLQLAGAGGEPGWATGKDGGDLKTAKSPWTTASAGVSEVRGTFSGALSTLVDKQQGVGTGDAGVDGFTSTAAQHSVYNSWKTRLDLVGRECGELSDKLTKAGNDHYKNDQAIGDAFRETRTRPIEPPPGG
ncbi:MAG: hypothetical protein ACRDP3_10150 [Streptomyces sp.]|uniref:hypothetical protein n=1 Tax=Streptomyces sp. TaxID=1931 RepID=UPI003D6C642E